MDVLFTIDDEVVFSRLLQIASRLLKLVYRVNVGGLIYGQDTKKSSYEIATLIQQFRDAVYSEGIFLDECNNDLYNNKIRPFYLEAVRKGM